MACTDCNSSYTKCFQVVSDQCVKYTGPDIEALDICSGQTLSSLEVIILQKLIDYSTGEGIELEDVDLTSCTFINGFVGCCAEDKSLSGLFNLIIEAICSLDTKIVTLDTKVTDLLSLTLDLQCLTVSSITLSNVFNAIIDKLCDIDGRLTTVEGTVISLQTQIDVINTTITSIVTTQITNQIIAQTATFLSNVITSCSGKGIVKSGSGNTLKISFDAMVPIGCPIPCVRPLSDFDSDGAGIAAKGMCGWHIMNGKDGTQDWRGFGFSGATNVQGPALFPAVDPTVLGDAGAGTSVGDRKGEVFHTLTIAETPVHNHTNGSYNSLLKVDGFGTVNATDLNNVSGTEANLTSSAPLLNVGGGQKHENRQPTVYGYWIVRIS